ncbi:MAG: alcohol dehydrogenase catalytic domain-containing protein [Burkholderiales bacterium]|nr:alcohol dehydrogenase catalytic domain-containing protein [Burkholderiales bacterium]
MRASIVIRAFNEEKRIGRLLSLLRAQTLADHEVIVVDSGSFDATREIARSHGARLVEIDSRDFTFGYSLNVGIRAAGAAIVGIVSAHVEPLDERWLENLIAPFEDPRVAMSYGRQLGAPVSKLGERLDFTRTFGAQRLRIPPAALFANNANSAIRRALWERTPFDERLTGLEDIAWAQHWLAQGWSVIYEPAAAVRHIHEETWAQVHHRYYREALAARQIGMRRRADLPAEAARELWRLLGDLAAAARSGELRPRLREILLFRLHKARGTLKGLARAAGADTPGKGDEIYFDRDYRAVLVKGPRRASLVRVESVPPAPSEVLVRVAYVGVCGTDLEVAEGTLGYFHSGLAGYPIIPGHEFSGHVAASGARVEGLQPGDPVVVECIQSCHDCEPCRRGNFIACARRRELGVMRQDGAYAQYVRVPARFVHRLPRDTDMKKAALCEPLAVVLKGLRRLEKLLGAGGGARCAVVGGGAIGWLAAQVLQARGQAVTLIERDAARRALLEGLGMRTDGPPADLARYDAIIEATGDPSALQQAIAGSAPGCTLLLLGLPYARHEFSFEHIVAFDKAVIGSVGSGAADFAEAISLLPSLALDPLTEAVMPLEAFGEAWASFRRREKLKILLAP